jgi:intein/homing endonuclease
VEIKDLDQLEDKYNELLAEGKQFIQTTIKNKYCYGDETCWEDIVTGRFRTEILKHFNEVDGSRIMDMLLARRYITAGSITSSYGLNDGIKTSLSNCYFIPIENDSIEGIYECCKKMARTFSYRGGVGICSTILRPSGCKVNNAAKSSTGAVSFMPTFSEVSHTIGQCIEENQLVLTNNGLKKIKAVEPTIDKVWTRVGWVKVLKKIYSGKKNIYKIKTTLGNTIKASKEHIFLSVDVNNNIITSKLEEFQKSEAIIVIPGPKETTNINDVLFENTTLNSNHINSNMDIHFPIKLDDEFAYLLGFIYGNGYIDRNNRNKGTSISIDININYVEVKEKICKIIKKYFNYDPKISLYKNKHAERLRIHSILICNWLEENKLLKQKSNDIIVPSKIMCADKTIQMAFYCGFFDADGTASNPKTAGYRCVSTSRTFIDSLQLILSYNGILSKIHEEIPKKYNWKTTHVLNVTGSYFKRVLIEKTRHSFKIQSNSKDIGSKDCHKVPVTASKLGVSYTKYGCAPGLLSLSKFTDINEKENFNLTPLIIDYVEEITPCGEAETYDLMLEKEHLFWCQGFYTHNSGRRGALIITLDCRHPDTPKFIRSKAHPEEIFGKDPLTGKVQDVFNANISLKLTNVFMDAVKNDKDWTFIFPDTTFEKYNKEWDGDYDKWISKGYPIIEYETVKAKDLFDSICEANWLSADPGIAFWNNVIDWSTGTFDSKLTPRGFNP